MARAAVNAPTRLAAGTTGCQWRLSAVAYATRAPSTVPVAPPRQARSSDSSRNSTARLHAGAAGFLLKDTLAADLVTAARAVAGGQNAAAPTVTRHLIRHLVGTAPRTVDASRLATLTARETDVLALVAQGMSNQEIADRLHVTEGTVKTHVSRVLARLDRRDRIHAVIYAYQNGIA